MGGIFSAVTSCSFYLDISDLIRKMKKQQMEEKTSEQHQIEEEGEEQSD